MKPRPLTIYFLTGLTIFYLYGFIHRDHTALPQWHISYLRARVPAEPKWSTIAKVPMPFGEEMYDSAARALGGVGGLIRYLAHSYLQGQFLGDPKLEPEKKPRSYAFWQIPFQYPQNRKRLLLEFGEPFKKAVQVLQGHHLPYVILLVPTKLSIERNWMDSQLPEPDPHLSLTQHSREDSRLIYESMRNLDPEHMPDLYNIFSEAHRSEPENMLYVPLDPHWTSFAQALAARAATEMLLTQFGAATQIELSQDRLLSGYREQPEFTYGGLEPFPAFFIKSHPELEWKEPLFVLNQISAPTQLHRIILTGSSYTQRLSTVENGLGQLIKTALGRPLHESSIRGGNTSGGLKRLVSEGFHFQSGDALVWEIPLEWAIGPKNNAADLTETIPQLFSPEVKSLGPALD